MSFATVLGAMEPVSKPGASHCGTRIRLGEARGLTVFGKSVNKRDSAPETAGANWKHAMTGCRWDSAPGVSLFGDKHSPQ
jgi:hypothetical protein